MDRYVAIDGPYEICCYLDGALLGSAPRYARFINRLISKSRTYGLNEYSMAVLLRWLHAADARGREVYRLPGAVWPKISRWYVGVGDRMWVSYLYRMAGKPYSYKEEQR